MYIASLSSSSTKGNAYLAWSDDTRPVLIDCGISIRRLVKCLDELGMKPEDISSLFITHEHADHVCAMSLVTPVAQKFQIPVYSSPGFWGWYMNNVGSHLDASLVKVIQSGEFVDVDGLTVQALGKPHDAAEPLAFTVQSEGGKAAFVTDLGYVPDSLKAGIEDSTHLVFESNHDTEMEKNSGRPIYLIRRVLGKLGHLSNDQASECLGCLVSRNTRQVVLAHLSLDCNTPEMAVDAVTARLREEGMLCDVSAAPSGEMAVFGC